MAPSKWGPGEGSGNLKEVPQAPMACRLQVHIQESHTGCHRHTLAPLLANVFMYVRQAQSDLLCAEVFDPIKCRAKFNALLRANTG